MGIQRICADIILSSIGDDASGNYTAKDHTHDDYMLHVAILNFASFLEICGKEVREAGQAAQLIRCAADPQVYTAPREVDRDGLRAIAHWLIDCDERMPRSAR